MKNFIATIAFSLAGTIAGFSETTVWTTTFSDKKPTLSSTFPNSAKLEIAYVSCNDAATNSKTISQLTSGVIASTQTLFTPNTNVQNDTTSKGWTANFTVKNNGSETIRIGKISLDVVAFNASGNAQTGARNVKMSVSLDGQTFSGVDTVITNFSTNGQTVEAVLPRAVELAPGKTCALAISAGTPASVQGGSFFGLRAFSGISTEAAIWNAWTLPQGFVAKNVPAGATSYFSANVQKPAIVDSGADFSVNADFGEITILADNDVNFPALLENGRAYLLEIVTEKGDAVFLINRDSWRGESADAWRANGNALTVESFDAVRLLAETDATAFRLREAWTIDEIFGASFQSGEMKVGTSLSGDSVNPSLNGKDEIKLFYKKDTGWATTGKWGANAVFGNIPLHPHEPVRIVRKSGRDLVLSLTGTAPGGDKLVKLDSAREIVCAGDAFPQTLASSGASALRFLTSAKIFSGGEWSEAEDSDELGDAILLERSAEDSEEIFKTFKILSR